MKVFLTGGTGFVGAHTVAAILDAGHEPRLLVRNPARLAPTLGALGLDVDALDVVVGDMTDPAAVAEGAKGCDAAIHAAAVVGALDRKEAAGSVDINVRGAELVIDASLDAGCAAVVHVSSIAAVFTPSVPVISSDLPTATRAASPYTRSKALAEDVARARQAGGAPVVIVSPGGVVGPPVGELYGEAANGFESMLRTGFLPFAQGAISCVDGRDLAQVLLAAAKPSMAGKRFIAGGPLVTLLELAVMVRQLTGRRFPVLRVPGAVFRGLGHVVDAARHVVSFESVYTAEAMELLTLAKPTDDRDVHEVLGVTYRDPAESIEASLRGLYAGGRLTARQVGRLA
jgi:nucleoside-diphosphate-sugar epimerase